MWRRVGWPIDMNEYVRKMVTFTGDGVVLVRCDKAYLGDCDIPEGVVKIGKSAFLGCHSIYEVYIPNSLKEIGKGAFFNASNVKGVNLKCVAVIGAYAFSGCDRLSRVVVRDDCLIGEYAFSETTEVITQSEEDKRIQEIFAGVLAQGIGVVGMPLEKTVYRTRVLRNVI